MHLMYKTGKTYFPKRNLRIWTIWQDVNMRKALHLENTGIQFIQSAIKDILNAI